MDCIFSGLMNNSTITPSIFDLGAQGNTTSFFLDSLNLDGESVDGNGHFRDKNRQKPIYLKPFSLPGVPNITVLLWLRRQQFRRSR